MSLSFSREGLRYIQNRPPPWANIEEGSGRGREDRVRRQEERVDPVVLVSAAVVVVDKAVKFLILPRHGQRAEEAVERGDALQVRAQPGREVERVRGAGRGAVAERQPPQVRDGDRVAAGVFQLAVEA